MNEVKLPFYARVALTLLTVVLIIFILSAGSSIFIPLFFALLIAVLLYPLTVRLENLGLKKGLAAFILVLSFVSLIALFVYFMSLQIISFSEDIPLLQTKVGQYILQLQDWIEAKFNVDSTEQTDYLNKSATGLLNMFTNSLSNILISVVSFTVWTIFVFVYTYFILHQRRLLLRFVLGLFKKEQQDIVYSIVNDSRSMINHYVLGLITEMAIMAILNCLIFSILGIKYAMLLGLLAAVLNIIPYLGIYTAMAIGMLVTLANGGATQSLQLGVVIIVTHFIDVNILLPRIVGGRVKINPLITIVAVITGSIIWGIAGMFLFIPLIAILKIIFQQVKGLQPWSLLIGESVD